jgi:hypothetical protein
MIIPDNDSASVEVIEDFLSKEVFDKTLQTVENSEKSLFKTVKQSLTKLGTSIEFLYPKYDNDKNRLNDSYIEESIINNSNTKQFEFLHEEIRLKLSNLLNIPCVYHEFMLKPYIRIWQPTNEILGIDLNDDDTGFHYDCNILFLDYAKLFNIEVKNVISGTIMFEFPDYSEFEYLPDSKTNDPKIYFDSKLNTSYHTKKLPPEKRNKIPQEFLNNRVIHRYKLNDLLLQWNFTIHRIAKIRYSNMNQRRITLQFSGIYDGEKIWLTS